MMMQTVPRCCCDSLVDVSPACACAALTAGGHESESGSDLSSYVYALDWRSCHLPFHDRRGDHRRRCPCPKQGGENENGYLG